MRLIERNAEDLRGVGLGETAEDVLSVLKRIRRAGVAVAFGEVTPGAIAIAAPILDARYPVASLCLTIPGQYANGGLIERISNEVRAAARLIASEI